MTAHWEDLADTGRALHPDECAELARAAAARIDTGGFARGGSGSFELLWRNDYSEAWLNTWWRLGHRIPRSRRSASASS
jgi:hypothetical protein